MIEGKNCSLKQTKIPSGWKVMSVPLLDLGWHSKSIGEFLTNFDASWLTSDWFVDNEPNV